MIFPEGIYSFGILMGIAVGLIYLGMKYLPEIDERL